MRLPAAKKASVSEQSPVCWRFHYAGRLWGMVHGGFHEFAVRRGRQAGRGVSMNSRWQHTSGRDYGLYERRVQFYPFSHYREGS